MAVKVFLTWLMLLGAAAAAQAHVLPECANETALDAQYDRLEWQIERTADRLELAALEAEQAPVRAQLDACVTAQMAADTVTFEQLAKMFVAADHDLVIALARQKRLRREPWHKEFWQWRR
jgi:hypothetical protein